MEDDLQDRHARHGRHLFQRAAELGWKDDGTGSCDGEGPLEFITRTAYQTGWDDHLRRSTGNE